ANPASDAEFARWPSSGHEIIIVFTVRGLHTGRGPMGLPLRELRFRDRSHAGQALASRLPSLRHAAPIVLGIAGGGVPVAAEVAPALGADLDVLVIQPVRSPPQPHVVVGVLAEGGALTLYRGSTLSDEELDDAMLRARRELRRRAQVFRGGR